MRSVSCVFLGVAAIAACGEGDSHGSLVSITDEPEGPNCTHGGTVIHSGIDRDDDAILDVHEIISSEYICLSSATVRCLEGQDNLPGPLTLVDESSFAAIDGVNCIDGDLLIIGTHLATLPELDDLHTVTGSLIVAGNNDLVSLGGLATIRAVGRKYVVQANDSLVDLSALGNLKQFLGLSIIANDSLPDVAGLAQLTELNGGLQISNNSALTSLRGLDNVTRGLRERIIISSNPNLASVDALANLRSAVLVEFLSNASLTSIALPSLEKVDVNLNIKDNAALEKVELPVLYTSGGLFFRSNPALTLVDAPQLVLTGALVFEQDLALREVVLQKLAYITADLDLLTLPLLETLSLRSLSAVGGRLQLLQLPLLPDLTGLATLASIGGDLRLQGAAILTDFTGLGSLVDVVNMTVTQNAQLSSFSGLDSFAKVGGNLVITSNANLPMATASTFASSITVVGDITIN